MKCEREFAFQTPANIEKYVMHLKNCAHVFCFRHPSEAHSSLLCLDATCFACNERSHTQTVCTKKPIKRMSQIHRRADRPARQRAPAAPRYHHNSSNIHFNDMKVEIDDYEHDTGAGDDGSPAPADSPSDSGIELNYESEDEHEPTPKTPIDIKRILANPATTAFIRLLLNAAVSKIGDDIAATAASAASPPASPRPAVMTFKARATVPATRVTIFGFTYGVPVRLIYHPPTTWGGVAVRIGADGNKTQEQHNSSFIDEVLIEYADHIELLNLAWLVSSEVFGSTDAIDILSLDKRGQIHGDGISLDVPHSIDILPLYRAAEETARQAKRLELLAEARRKEEFELRRRQFNVRERQMFQNHVRKERKALQHCQDQHQSLRDNRDALNQKMHELHKEHEQLHRQQEQLTHQTRQLQAQMNSPYTYEDDNTRRKRQRRQEPRQSVSPVERANVEAPASPESDNIDVPPEQGGVGKRPHGDHHERVLQSGSKRGAKTLLLLITCDINDQLKFEFTTSTHTAVAPTFSDGNIIMNPTDNAGIHIDELLRRVPIRDLTLKIQPDQRVPPNFVERLYETWNSLCANGNSSMINKLLKDPVRFERTSVTLLNDGLYNHGNECWLHSLVQMLASSDDVTQRFHETAITVNDPLLKSLATLLSILNRPGSALERVGRHAEANQLIQRIRALLPEKLRTGQQHDVRDLWEHLLHHLKRVAPDLYHDFEVDIQRHQWCYTCAGAALLKTTMILFLKPTSRALPKAWNSRR
jgi:hypothetical protein